MWYKDGELLANEIQKYGSLRKAAAANNVHHTTLSKWHKRVIGKTDNKIKYSSRVGAVITNDTATIIGPVGNISPIDLLKSHGLNPDDWDYSPTVNAWETINDGKHVVLSQLKLVCKRRLESVIQPAERKHGWKPNPPKAQKQKTVFRILVLPDPHCPHDEPVITAAVNQLAQEINPSKIVCLGDTSDNSPWKRHKPNPRLDVDAQTALNCTYEWLANLRYSAPNAEITIIPGNHDWWLYDRIKETFPALVTLKRPNDNFPVLSMRHLLRLDELHIDLIDTVGEYHDATYTIVDDLTALHGTRSGKHGGAAREIENWENTSVIQGHDHKLAMVAITKRLPDGSETQRYAISAGTMAKRDLGYDHARNVNQGFAVITVHPDGRWHHEFALYDPQNNDVTWRDWRYS